VTGRYAKGCALERGSHKRTPFGIAKMRGLATAAIPASIDLSPFAPPVVDQTVFSACEGCSSSSAIYTTLAKAGTPLGWVPSQSGIYRLARAVDRSDPSIPLLDQGTETNAVERALSDFGIGAMVANLNGTNCDLDGDTINAEPVLAELERDAVNLLVGTYQITSSGAEKVNDVKLALASGFAVRVDTTVDQAFEDWTPAQAPYGSPNLSASLGGHALFALGFSGNTFTIRNSWSASWGASGNLLASEAFIQQADCYVWSVKRAS
jgi:hypothetical protein